MTKMELAIKTVEWKIEDAMKTYEQAKEDIKNNIGSENTCISEYILHCATRMHDAEMKLRDLNEQLHMLQSLADEQ